MKRSVKVICVILGACIIAGGGYFFGYKGGYKTGQDSHMSAMPKKTIDVTQTNNETESTPKAEEKKPESTSEEKKDIPQQNNVRIIKKQSESSADSSWTNVEHSYNPEGTGNITLYTSAQKVDDEIIWDDGQKWIVEWSDGSGGYYTLYDQYVSNGSVYYDVFQKDNKTYINVYTMSGTGTTIKQYTQTNNGFEEKEVYNSGSVNRINSTIPSYK